MKLIALALVAIVVPASALADATAGMRKSASCTTCHGNDGNSAAAAYPNLAGQTAEYLVKQMRDLKEGRRVSQVMSTMIQIMSDQDIQDLADYFSANVPSASTFRTDPALVAEGKKLVDEAKCTSCHQSNFRGLKEIPRVSRQQYNYTVKQLKDFRDGVRTNDAGLMAPFAKNLTDDQIRAIVHYLSTL
jgi:cbb3-type cytochrome c oxidase subunit III